jgi:hypothetical protein
MKIFRRTGFYSQVHGRACNEAAAVCKGKNRRAVFRTAAGRWKMRVVMGGGGIMALP